MVSTAFPPPRPLPPPLLGVSLSASLDFALLTLSVPHSLSSSKEEGKGGEKQVGLEAREKDETAASGAAARQLNSHGQRSAAASQPASSTLAGCSTLCGPGASPATTKSISLSSISAWSAFATDIFC